MEFSLFRHARDLLSLHTHSLGREGTVGQVSELRGDENPNIFRLFWLGQASG